MLDYKIHELKLHLIDDVQDHVQHIDPVVQIIIRFLPSLHTDCIHIMYISSVFQNILFVCLRGKYYKIPASGFRLATTAWI